ncbi:MAG: GNAT family N-acetyltransferase [Treponema sp.]|nr:GNAT family N-acetyltransferase [Treponema sp.]
MDILKIDEHIILRSAEKRDTTLIINFISELAEYEHLTSMLEVNEFNLQKYIFEEKKAEVIIAEYDNKPAGFTLFFSNFSTFLGKPGIYIEDLFVKPEYRGKGLGKHLLSYLAKLVQDRKYGRLEWACLNWNEPSIKFYKSQGAQPLDEWTVYRISGKNIAILALK